MKLAHAKNKEEKKTRKDEQKAQGRRRQKRKERTGGWVGGKADRHSLVVGAVDLVGGGLCSCS